MIKLSWWEHNSENILSADLNKGHFVCVLTKLIIYIYISAVKINVNNALTQIPFNCTNFINARLTQCLFSAWPVAQPLVGEMERHSVANLATLLTSLSLSLSLSLSESAQFLFSVRQRRVELNSVKHRYYVACFSNFTCKYSQNHSTAIVIVFWVFYLIRQRLNYKDLCKVTSCKGELVM